jgi:hypothetical protein
MYENRKVRPVQTIPGMGIVCGENDEGVNLTIT